MLTSVDTTKHCARREPHAHARSFVQVLPLTNGAHVPFFNTSNGSGMGRKLPALAGRAMLLSFKGNILGDRVAFGLGAGRRLRLSLNVAGMLPSCARILKADLQNPAVAIPTHVQWQGRPPIAVSDTKCSAWDTHAYSHVSSPMLSHGH